MTQRSDSERVGELERRLEEVLKENAALREENSRLRKELEEWKRGHRARGKRRSSRPEGRRAGERLKPGRQPGHPGARRAVPKVDERIEYPAPGVCDCGGEVDQIDEVVSTIVEDIPEMRDRGDSVRERQSKSGALVEYHADASEEWSIGARVRLRVVPRPLGRTPTALSLCVVLK